MPHRGELKCIADGLLGSFVSRNNDYCGFWSLGMLYARALERRERTYSLALLGVGSEPDDDLSHALAAKYRAFLLEHMSRRVIPREWIEAAVLSIAFERPALPANVFAPQARPYLAQLVMHSAVGKSISLSRAGYCWPHNPDRESRSTRYHACHASQKPDA